MAKSCQYRQFLWLLLLLGACKEHQIEPASVPKQTTVEILDSGFFNNMALGNPSGALPVVASEDNYLIHKPAYSIGYSLSRGSALWVSWHVDTSWFGSSGRQDDFRVDTTLPKKWRAIAPEDYIGTGFDRGHLCPSADRTRDHSTNSSTFLMTNIAPQAPRMNREIWADLEIYLRDEVKEGSEIYIYSGTLGKGGVGSLGYATTLREDSSVVVPAHFYKIAVVLPQGVRDLERINTLTRVIAVLIPNSDFVEKGWEAYRTTVDALEDSTGFDFLNHLPLEVQAHLEAYADEELIE